MKIREKLNGNGEQLLSDGPVTIVAFGDSITHGAFGPGEFDYEAVYWNRLRQKLNRVRSYMPVNVINAGIGGVTAARSVSRLEQQVLLHRPDLVIVCFGLNDVNDPLEDYLRALRSIFARCRQAGTDVVFLTPNMLNTYVAEDTAPQHLEYAHRTAEMQNSGRMDRYMEAAIRLAEEMDVPVCDCYARWKELSRTQDTTRLLVNRINHPSREMHELFAEELFRLVMRDAPAAAPNGESLWKER